MSNSLFNSCTFSCSFFSDNTVRAQSPIHAYGIFHYLKHELLLELYNRTSVSISFMFQSGFEEKSSRQGADRGSSRCSGKVSQ